MNIFLYLDEDTWIHRLDPRTKLIGTVLLFMMALTFNHPLAVAGVSLFVFVIAIMAKALPNFWRMRYLMILLTVFSAVMWPFFAEGTTELWAWGPLHVSRESLLYAIAMGLRLATFVGIGLLLLSTTKNEELTNGLILLKLPYPFAFAISTAFRLVPTFAGVGGTIVQAQISRGLDLESGNIFSRVGKFIPLAVPLFIYAIRHTNLLAMALESRGFSPEHKRSLYLESHMVQRDYVVLILLTLIWLAMLALRLQGYGEVLPRI